MHDHLLQRDSFCCSDILMTKWHEMKQSVDTTGRDDETIQYSAETKYKCAEYRLAGSQISLVPGHLRISEPRLERITPGHKHVETFR